jgi:adenylate kinase family enzyme
VDELTWEPSWTEVPLEIQGERIKAICAKDEWILDTAYAKWIDIPMARVQLIVCLDYSRWVSLSRLLRRCVARVVDKKPVCNGNFETLRNAFSRNSIIGWHFKSFGRKRGRMRKWETQDEGPQILRFSKPSDAEAWLSELGTAQAVT